MTKEEHTEIKSVKKGGRGKGEGGRGRTGRGSLRGREKGEGKRRGKRKEGDKRERKKRKKKIHVCPKTRGQKFAFETGKGVVEILILII